MRVSMLYLWLCGMCGLVQEVSNIWLCPSTSPSLLVPHPYSLGFSCGPPHQACPLPWTTVHLPNQVVLHLQHSHHSAKCFGLEPLHHFPGTSSGGLAVGFGYLAPPPFPTSHLPHHLHSPPLHSPPLHPTHTSIFHPSILHPFFLPPLHPSIPTSPCLFSDAGITFRR